MSDSVSSADLMPPPQTNVPLAKAMLLTAMAGGMGWGIRGQYGHETGAMIAGVLVASVLVMLFASVYSTLHAARAIAWTTIAISFGGCMTYGQTVGLTHDTELIGNTQALRWGLLGLFIKGGIWIGFGGLALGMALGGKTYTPGELALAFGAIIFLMFIGIFMLNWPYAPDEGLLPKIYFSDHWDWEPDKELKPRREKWGGLLFALIGLWSYVRFFRKDALASRMAFWGILAGGCGFAGGQSIQAFHAWHPEWFRDGFLAQLNGYLNWWNIMETSFGLIFGALLALGLWVHRRHIATPEASSESISAPASLEVSLLTIYLLALTSWSFQNFSTLDNFADLAITMGMLPFLAVAAGRHWPLWMCLPVTLLPIAGKTLKHVVYDNKLVEEGMGWAFLLIVPMTLALVLSLFWADPKRLNNNGLAFSKSLLVINALTYYLLNFAFFHFPKPWLSLHDWTHMERWTSRSPNHIVFTVCLLGLVIGALVTRGNSPSSGPIGQDAEAKN